MKNLETIYDSSLGKGRELYRFKYVAVTVCLVEIELREEYYCSWCSCCILPGCFALCATIVRAENTSSSFYCKDCCTQRTDFAYYEAVDWSKYICDGPCSSLHLTWYVRNLNLQGVDEEFI